MANKKNLTKFELIENNQRLIEVLVYIFGGQVLDIDLREFCVKFGLYKTESQYNTVIKILLSRKILRKEKLVKTNNNVLIASSSVFDFLCIEKKVTYSIETVTRNSYTNFILLNYIKLNIDDDIQTIANNLKSRSTLLSTKRDVEACFRPFLNNLTKVGAEAKLEAIYKESKRKAKLKNRKETEIEEVTIMHKETLQTLREMDIFVSKYKNSYKVFITDNNSNYTLANLSKKIATAIRILSEHTNTLDTVNVKVIVKDSYTKNKLEASFIKLYENKDSEEDTKEVALSNSINKNINKNKSNLKIKYELIETTDNKVYKLKNTYKNELDVVNNLSIVVVDTDIATRHNSNLKALALIEHQEEVRRKQMEEEIERRVREEIERRSLGEETIVS